MGDSCARLCVTAQVIRAFTLDRRQAVLARPAPTPSEGGLSTSKNAFDWQALELKPGFWSSVGFKVFGFVFVLLVQYRSPPTSPLPERS